MRPQPIRRFETIYLVSLALGFVATLLTWQPTWEALRVYPVPRALGPLLVPGVGLAAIGLHFALVLLVVRRRSNVAKWALVALIALMAAIMVISMLRASFGGFGDLMGALILVLRIVAVRNLFFPEARAWLGEAAATDGGASEKIAPSEP